MPISQSIYDNVLTVTMEVTAFNCSMALFITSFTSTICSTEGTVFTGVV